MKYKEHFAKLIGGAFKSAVHDRPADPVRPVKKAPKIEQSNLLKTVSEIGEKQVEYTVADSDNFHAAADKLFEKAAAAPALQNVSLRQRYRHHSWPVIWNPKWTADELIAKAMERYKAEETPKK